MEHCVASQTLGTGRTLSPLFPFLHEFLNGWCLCFIVVTSDPVFAKYKIIERGKYGLVLKLNYLELKVLTVTDSDVAVFF